MYKLFIKPFLFLLSPEKAHHFSVQTFRFLLKLPLAKNIAKSLFQVTDNRLEKQLFGLTFKNPVGLAAGFDKDGKYMKTMSHLGFGFIEVGTVTPKPQVGNPQPRLFRLPKDKGLINRMGFNNEGLEALIERLKQEKPDNIIIGGNIGKNKVTPNKQAIEDYVVCFKGLFDYVDYFVVNVSSPNTPNLRALQEKEPLTQLLTTLQNLNKERLNPKPILLKIAPDLTNGQLDDIIEIVQETKLDGIIATNTTISREGLSSDKEKIEKIGNGGLSGAPLRQRSTEVIRYLKEQSNGQLTIIGVGGIDSPEDALEKLQAGASLIQVYSGLIYEGPSFIKRINQHLLDSQYQQ